MLFKKCKECEKHIKNRESMNDRMRILERIVYAADNLLVHRERGEDQKHHWDELDETLKEIFEFDGCQK